MAYPPGYPYPPGVYPPPPGVYAPPPPPGKLNRFFLFFLKHKILFREDLLTPS